MKALITGITGQDGSLLADYLLSIGYEVAGAFHTPVNSNDPKFSNYSHLLDTVAWEHVNYANESSIKNLVAATNPDECYHLGAKSFPSAGFDGDFMPFQSNVQNTYLLLAALRAHNPKSKFFFAGSSEIFGNNPSIKMNEESLAQPRTMYGVSKMACREIVRNYREMGFFACTGMLFNHESPRRGEEFVTRKITLAAAKIKLGLQKELILGSLEAKRDWSDAGDFIRAFHAMLQLAEPTDLVLGSGKAHSVREFVEHAFKSLNLNYQDYVKMDERFNRPSPNYLEADTTKAQAKIGWKPSKTFEEIVETMVRADYNRLKAEK